MLLSAAGGALDAFAYRNHGHVFAGAMTGNAVLVGIGLISGRPGEALHSLFPILAFIAGICLSKLAAPVLGRSLVTLGLLGEMLVLLVASFLPASFPDLAFVPLLALASGWQIASYNTVEGYKYNSTFITGDLRAVFSGLFDARQPQERADALAKFRDVSLIVLAFIAGAVAAAWLAKTYANHTLWFVEIPLGCILIAAVVASTSSSR